MFSNDSWSLLKRCSVQTGVVLQREYFLCVPGILWIFFCLSKNVTGLILVNNSSFSRLLCWIGHFLELYPLTTFNALKTVLFFYLIMKNHWIFYWHQFVGQLLVGQKESWYSNSRKWPNTKKKTRKMWTTWLLNHWLKKLILFSYINKEYHVL